MQVSPDIVAYGVAGLAAIVGSGGAAWAGVKVSLNGIRERVARMEMRQDHMDDKLDRISESVARLETYNALNPENN